MYGSLAQAIRVKVAAGGYTPEAVNVPTPGKGLPETVRQLIDCKVSVYAPDEPMPCDFPNLRALSAMPARLDLSGLAIRPADLRQYRPQAPHRISRWKMPQVLSWQPFCMAFWRWLKKYHPTRLPDVDHSVHIPMEQWDIIQRFETELNRHGNWELNELFGDAFYDDDSVNDSIYLPLFCADTGCEDVPLIEFLDHVVNCCLHRGRIHISSAWPEQAIEESAERFDAAFECFLNILEMRRWRLLPRPWAKACKALTAWTGWDISFWDYDQVRFHFDGMTAARMQWVFAALTQIDQLKRGLCDLFQSFFGDPEFWTSLIRHLNGVAKRYPELNDAKKTQSKPNSNPEAARLD